MAAPRRGDLSLAEKGRLAIEVLGTYGRVRFLMRRRTFPQAVEALRAVRPPEARPPDSELDALRVGLRLGRIVGRSVGALPTDSRCLMRSLVLLAMLERRGIRSSVHIGVRSGEEFAAHAWVEYRDRALLPSGEAYGRLLEI